VRYLYPPTKIPVQWTEPGVENPVRIIFTPSSKRPRQPGCGVVGVHDGANARSRRLFVEWWENAIHSGPE
jgi:hypothetical protein